MGILCPPSPEKKMLSDIYRIRKCGNNGKEGINAIFAPLFKPGTNSSEKGSLPHCHAQLFPPRRKHRSQKVRTTVSCAPVQLWRKGRLSFLCNSTADPIAELHLLLAADHFCFPSFSLSNNR